MRPSEQKEKCGGTMARQPSWTSGAGLALHVPPWRVVLTIGLHAKDFCP